MFCLHTCSLSLASLTLFVFPALTVFVLPALTVFKDASSLFLYFTFCFFWRPQKKFFFAVYFDFGKEKRMV